MKKVLLVSSILFVIGVAFSFSAVLATGDMNAANTIKNVTNGTKNVVQDATNTVGGAINRGVQGTKNAVQNGTNMNTNNSNTTDMIGTTNNGNYNATRTSTDDSMTLGGLSTNLWTWIIVAILGVLIVALVWYYAKQNSTFVTNDGDE